MPRIVPWVALFGLVAACAGTRAAPTPAAADFRTVLKVENLTFVDLSIYVLRDNQRQRLGRSTANTTAYFTIPAAFVESPRSLRFITDPVGPVGEAISRDVFVRPGDTVFMRLGPF
jgi:hypothetical protein